MAEEIREEEKIEEMHEALPNHFHVLKRLDGKYSVIKEIDADEVEEVILFDSKEEAEAYKEGEPATEENIVDEKKVDITDVDEEEASDPDEVRKFEEELEKTTVR